MTEEKIKQGEELLEELNRLKAQRRKWAEGVCLRRIELSNRNQSTLIIDGDDSFVNFGEVKLLAIAKIDKRISEVQEEFDRL